MKYALMTLTLMFAMPACGGSNQPTSDPTTTAATSPDAAKPADGTPPRKELAIYNVQSVLQNFCPPDLKPYAIKSFQETYDRALADYKRCAVKAVDETEKEECRKDPKYHIYLWLETYCDLKNGKSKIFNGKFEGME